MAGPRPLGRIHLDGAGRLRSTLKAAGAGLDDLKAAHLKAAELVAARARTTAPVGPPPLHVKDTIRAAGTARAAIIRAGRARVAYAMPLHWGHKTPDGTLVKAQPWIAQAAQELAPVWMPIYLTEIAKIIDTVEGTTTP